VGRELLNEVIVRIRLGFAVLALLGASCGSAPPDAASAGGEAGVEAQAAPLVAPPDVDETLPAAVVTTVPVLANPLTQGLIATDDLARMPLRRLDSPLAGFIASLQREETNEAAVDRLPASYDEADDVEAFGRENGYRTILRPTRFNGSGTLAVDTWVTLFTTAPGASEYLIDFAKDISKGQDAGRAPDLKVDSVSTFAVEEVGEEAMGLVVTESEADSGTVYTETIVVFRLGRLLAFVSLFRQDDIDVRVALLTVAEVLEQQIIDVLDGSVEVAEAPPPPELASYTFDYRQSMTQRYQEVQVTATDDDDDEVIGGGDGPGDEGEPDPTATTIPVVYAPRTDSGTISSRGTVVGTDVDCTVDISGPGVRTSRRFLLVGGKAWVSDGGRAFVEIDPYEEPYGSEIVFCPGWAPSRTDSGVRPVTRPGTGTKEPWEDLAGERFTLTRDDLVLVGLGGTDASGISLSRFDIVTAGDGPWVVEVTLSMSGSTIAMEKAVGPGFYPGASVSISLEFHADDLNDETLAVAAPE
jgi:hypothetical protein